MKRFVLGGMALLAVICFVDFSAAFPPEERDRDRPEARTDRGDRGRPEARDGRGDRPRPEGRRGREGDRRPPEGNRRPPEGRRRPDGDRGRRGPQGRPPEGRGPRDQGFGGPGGRGPGRDFGPPNIPLLIALDTDKNGEISGDEIENATAALKTLDKNNDGKLTRDELRPRFDGPPRGGRENAGPPRDGRGPREGRGGRPDGAGRRDKPEIKGDRPKRPEDK